jgi:subtilisin family serine protease
LDRIDAREGLDGRYSYDAGEKAKVVVFVMDTGIRISHHEFQGRAQYGYNFVDDNDNADDCNGHGTHVAGTIAGKTYGVAKDATLVALKVVGCDGSGEWGGLIASLDWIVDKKVEWELPSVLSASLGADAFVPMFNRFASKLTSYNITAVVAAGNEEKDACETTPASLQEFISVGATDKDDSITWFSNFGPCVDIFAPGEDILSASHQSDTDSVAFSGTSMATPHVSGAVALYLQRNPSASPQEVKDALFTYATLNVVRGLNSSTPNRFLYLRFDLSKNSRDLSGSGDFDDRFNQFWKGSISGGQVHSPVFELAKGQTFRAFLNNANYYLDDIDMCLERKSADGKWPGCTSDREFEDEFNSLSYSTVEFIECTIPRTGAYRVNIYAYNESTSIFVDEINFGLQTWS